MKPVSVVMPAYNAEYYIAAAIESVLQQTYVNWELIVIDDGSTDQTAAIVNQFAARDKRITYMYQPNSKQGAARNAGIQNSAAGIIAFLDADDLWLPDKLNLLIAQFASDDCDLVFSDAYVFEGTFDPAKIPATQERFMVPALAYEGKRGLEDFLTYNRIPLLTAVFKKEAVIKAGLFSNRGICEDYEMWLRLLLSGCKFRSVDIPLAAYRKHSTSTTDKDRLAIDHCIDVIFELGKDVPLSYKTVFSRYLKVWYLRKLRAATDIRELKEALRVIYNQQPAQYGLGILRHLMISHRRFLGLNKRLAMYLLA